MEFILENYLIFVLIGLFLVFALIGYIIDTVRKNNADNSNNGNYIPPQVNEVNENNIQQMNLNPTNMDTNTQIESVNITNINENQDDLLNSYNDTSN